LNKKSIFAAICAQCALSLAFAQAPAPAPAPADAAAAPPAAPMPLSTPSFTGPLSNLPPATFDAGPFGKLSFNGVVSGMGLSQTNPVPGDENNQAALSNGQIFVQKTDGVFQFYIQAGAYSIPSLAVPFLGAGETSTNLFGAVPVGFVKLQAGKNTSFSIGSLPTLIGAEYTFTFENMNVARGLLWNQEPAISKGIQVNQTMGKFNAAFSFNDGFYSNRYSWVSGSLGYANGPHAISFVAGGNLGQTKFQTYATPVQNNGSLYNVIYTFTKGPWIVTPYYQYTSVPTNTKLGIAKGANTNGFAILGSYAAKSGFSLPVRFEYISSSGSVRENTVNLLFGQGSAGTSFTVTPTYQKGGFFARSDFSVVHATDYLPGAVFGPLGNDATQFRVQAEIGFIFGNNLTK
jgi:hypothetical protein